MRRPDLFYDPTKDLVYSLGGGPYQYDGTFYDLSVPVQLWGFELGDGHVNWELEQAGTTQNFPMTSVLDSALTATTLTGHYCLGGAVNYLLTENSQEYIDLLGLSDMVNFNFDNQSWYNQTVPGYYISSGEAQYVPIFGQEGVILFFGGNWPSDANVAGYDSLVGLDTILVYDVNSNTFFKQPATNAPISRINFCSVTVGTNASSNSSYEMCVSKSYCRIASTNNESIASYSAAIQVVIQTPPQQPTSQQSTYSPSQLFTGSPLPLSHPPGVNVIDALSLATGR
jgi:hypothetical protein